MSFTSHNEAPPKIKKKNYEYNKFVSGFDSENE